MKKGEQKKKQSVDCLDYKTIWTTILCTVVAILLVLCFIFIGIKMAGGSIKYVANGSDISIIQVQSEAFRLDYSLDDAQIAKDDKTAYIFNGLETKYHGENYAILNSKTQLDNLLNTYNAVSGLEVTTDIDSGFFETGSVVAIAVENKVYVNVSTPSITRDENYELTATMDVTRISDEEMDSTDKTNSTLFLVRVQNIQPTQVETQFNELH